MKVNVLAFGIAKDIVGGYSIELDLAQEATVQTLRSTLQEKYPRLKEVASFMVAVNNEYATDQDLLQQQDEIAIIPPVSGG